MANIYIRSDSKLDTIANNNKVVPHATSTGVPAIWFKKTTGQTPNVWETYTSQPSGALSAAPIDLIAEIQPADYSESNTYIPKVNGTPLNDAATGLPAEFHYNLSGTTKIWKCGSGN